jgi:hypothetical protein
VDSRGEPKNAGANPAPAPSISIIGGTKYDEDALANHIEGLPQGTWIVVGDGRGAEKRATELAQLNVHLPPRPDVYGKSARKVNVEQVLSWDPTSPVLLVGNGERVKQAEAWLKRANWGREVHRIP